MAARHPNQKAASASQWQWVASGALVGVVLAMLVFSPARWLAAWVFNASSGQLSLPDAQGTVWRGSSQLVLSGGAGSQGSSAVPGRISWRLSPGWSGVKLELQALCCMSQSMQLAWQFRSGGWALAVADHQSNWPAGLLVGLGTPWNTIAAEGNLAISNRGLSLEWAEGRMALSGTLQIDAQDMASRLTTINPMGSYRLKVEGGPLTSLNLQTLQGSLELSGSGQWVAGRLRFEGVASAVTERQEALSNLLNIIGRREGARSIIKVG